MAFSFDLKILDSQEPVGFWLSQEQPSSVSYCTNIKYFQLLILLQVRHLRKASRSILRWV